MKMQRLKQWLGRLSFRTGLTVLGVCAVCYVLSFCALALPVSAAVRGGLWAAFFGLAKTAQYTALLILGREGWLRVKGWFSRKSAV